MPKSPIAAVIQIPQAVDQSGEERQKKALDAISRIAAGVDAKPQPRAVAANPDGGDDPNGFLSFF